MTIYAHVTSSLISKLFNCINSGIKYYSVYMGNIKLYAFSLSLANCQLSAWIATSNIDCWNPNHI